MPPSFDIMPFASNAAHRDLSRRQFVTMLAAGASSLVVASTGFAASGPSTKDSSKPTGAPDPKLESPPPGPVHEKLGWAVVGLGDFAQGYVLPALGRASLSKPVSLVSGNAKKLKDVAARYAISSEHLYSYDTMGTMRDNAAIDVVYIVTPNSTHADLTIKALEAGKHVMCEKPMANSASDCQRMIDAAKAANRKLMIAYRAHFEPNNLKAKQMIDAGELGPIAFATSDHHRPLDPAMPRDAWRMKKAIAGGGSLVDIGIYSLNGLLWLLGENPSSVCASVYSPPGDARFAEVENIFTAQLVFPSGRRANISSGYDSTKKRIDVFGQKGVIVLDPATEYRGNKLVLTTKEGNQEIKPKAGSEVQFTGEIDHFSHAIKTNTAILTPGEMGLRDVRIIEALYQSARTQSWVHLNPDMTLQT